MRTEGTEGTEGDHTQHERVALCVEDHSMSSWD